MNPPTPQMRVRTNRASFYSEIVADSITQNNTHEFEDMKLGDMNLQHEHHSNPRVVNS